MWGEEFARYEVLHHGTKCYFRHNSNLLCDKSVQENVHVPRYCLFFLQLVYSQFSFSYDGEGVEILGTWWRPNLMIRRPILKHSHW